MSKTSDEIRIQKTFKNEGGDILVRSAKNILGACGIVEMLHLWDNNKAGCVIGAWKVRDADECPFPEFYVVLDRLTSTKYSFDILEAIKYGQSLARIILESDSL